MNDNREKPTATFRWKCSYRGTVWYEVIDQTGRYEVELLRDPAFEDRAHFNGTEAEWQRDVIGKHNVLVRDYMATSPLPDPTLHAFNAWRRAEHAVHLAQLLAEPDRYGQIADTDPVRTPPPPVSAGYYVVGEGWKISARPDGEAHVDQA